MFYKTYHKKPSFLLASFCFVTILGLGIFLYDDDLSDTDDFPDIALQFPVIIYYASNNTTFIGLTSESISLPFINKIHFLDRSPPA